MTQRLNGEKVRKLRELSGLMLKDLAGLANLDSPTLSKIETGRRFGTPPQHKRIADALGVDLVTLVDDEVA